MTTITSKGQHETSLRLHVKHEGIYFKCSKPQHNHQYYGKQEDKNTGEKVSEFEGDSV